jgi:hypothetical protein
MSLYQALSYVWNQETGSELIICGGRKVQATRNLFNALRQIYATYGEAKLWVDAICINQADMTEKTVTG